MPQSERTSPLPIPWQGRSCKIRRHVTAGPAQFSLSRKTVCLFVYKRMRHVRHELDNLEIVPVPEGYRFPRIGEKRFRNKRLLRSEHQFAARWVCGLASYLALGLLAAVFVIAHFVFLIRGKLDVEFVCSWPRVGRGAIFYLHFALCGTCHAHVNTVTELRRM